MYIGVVVSLVVIMTAMCSFFQEFKLGTTMENLKNSTPPKSVVHRGSKISDIDAKDLLVGDVIDVKFGDKLSVDIYAESPVQLRLCMKGVRERVKDRAQRS